MSDDRRPSHHDAVREDISDALHGLADRFDQLKVQPEDVPEALRALADQLAADAAFRAEHPNAVLKDGVWSKPDSDA
jgi:hypothetical protein